MANIDRKSLMGGHVSAAQATPVGAPAGRAAVPAASQPLRSPVLRWLVNDIPFLAMLALAAVGVVLRLPVVYWVIVTPVFAVISVFEGWRHFADRNQKLGFVVRLSLVWCALLLAIYVLYNSGVRGEMNANSISLAMMTLLALGTFVAGVQARVWQICAVGGVLFVAVPGLGWLDQSPLLLLAGACAIAVLASVGWWITQGRHEDGRASGTTRPPL